MSIWNLPLLSIEIWLPIVGGLFLLNGFKKAAELPGKKIAGIISGISLLLCIPLLQGFNSQSFEMQWLEKLPWIPSLNIHYALGLDGFSLSLLILNNLMSFLVMLSSNSIKMRSNQYLAAFLMMQGLINGALLAQDAVLFYFFWEAMLVPMFLIIGIWGASNRVYATLKFFLYTFVGSVLLLVAIIYLHLQALKNPELMGSSFNILSFHQLALDLETQKWLFLAFFLAFAVKVPMWPIHTWLPDAHVEAPTGGSVILAAILLKMGGYGFLRFLLPILPDASRLYAWPVILLSLIAITYIAFVAIVQRDMKKLIAYSSISHMGFVTLGLFLVYPIMAGSGDSQTAVLGIQGGLLEMISHGFVSGALFLCIGVLYDRLHSRLIEDYSGVVNRMPIFASFFILFALANIGFPGTSGFVGEFFVILSASKAQFSYALVASSILILGAAYTLWMVKRVVWGPVKQEAVATLSDLTSTEIGVFSVLVLAILLIGCWPSPLLDLLYSSSNHLLDQMMHSKAG